MIAELLLTQDEGLVESKKCTYYNFREEHRAYISMQEWMIKATFKKAIDKMDKEGLLTHKYTIEAPFHSAATCQVCKLREELGLL